MNAVETVEHRGHAIKVFYDEDPLNPRKDWDGHLGKMVCFHGRYDLGDEHDISQHDFEGWEEMADHLRKEEGAVIILPLYLYDHSGITMSVGGFLDPWDSGQVGLIYCTRAELLEQYSRKKLSKGLLEKAEQRLRGEVEVYDQYLTGQVYGYQVEPLEGYEGETCDDSCWGFFGEPEYMISEAKETIDYAITQLALPLGEGEVSANV